MRREGRGKMNMLVLHRPPDAKEMRLLCHGGVDSVVPVHCIAAVIHAFHHGCCVAFTHWNPYCHGTVVGTCCTRPELENLNHFRVYSRYGLCGLLHKVHENNRSDQQRFSPPAGEIPGRVTSTRFLFLFCTLNASSISTFFLQTPNRDVYARPTDSSQT